MHILLNLCIYWCYSLKDAFTTCILYMMKIHHNKYKHMKLYIINQHQNQFCKIKIKSNTFST